MIDIEDREQAQRELQRLVDAIPQHIVVLHGDGLRLYANQAVLDYHGLTSEQFLVVDHSQCFHTDDLETYDRHRQSGIASAEPWEAEVRVHRKDGQYRWFLVRARPLRDQQGHVIRWYLARTDIEDRKQAEAQLRRAAETRAVFEKLIHNSMDGILAFDREGRYTVWNPPLERIFGINLSASSPSTLTTVSGIAPNQRPSGVNPSIRMGSPHAV